MKIVKYWAKKKYVEEGDYFIGLGWSDDSLTEAQRMAQEKLDMVVTSFKNGTLHSRPRQAWKKYYSQRALREEMVEEFWDSRGELYAAITRSRTGVLVLNTARLAFIDVDYPPQPFSLGRIFMSIFQPHKKAQNDLEYRETMDKKVKTVAQKLEIDYSFRIYKTKGGARVMVTNREIDPTGPESERLMEEFEADKLYRRLSKSQESYRARLTPKPWRMTGARLPRYPFNWPFADDAERQASKEWEEKYSDKSAPFTTCHLYYESPDMDVDANFVDIIDKHDQITKSNQKDLPLA